MSDPLLCGDSPVFRDFRAALERAAASQATLLLQGESGTGKSAATRYAHARPPARGEPLVSAASAEGYAAAAATRWLYNFGRPVPTIRAGDTDGNAATAPDPAWESFMNTPPLPGYPSTRSVAGGAATLWVDG